MNKNRNWILIGLIVVFIVGWEYFVIRPNMKKKLEHQQQSTATAPNSATSAPTPAAPVAALPGTPAAAPEGLNSDLRDQAQIVEFSAQRRARIYPNGAFGEAEFLDYKERHSEEKIVLAKEGWAWSSTDANVAACLAALKQVGQGFVFRASVPQGRCQVSYEPFNQPAGLVRASLTLSGFEGAKGFVEYKSRDGYATGATSMDHRYLGYVQEGSRHWAREKDLLEANVKIGKVSWLAWGDRYFGAHLLPRGTFNPNLVYGPTGSGKDHVYFGFQYPIVASAADSKYEFDVFVGTRSPETVVAVDPSLLESIDFGFFGAVARALLWLLKKIHAVVGNYGVAIIVLTLIVRAAFWPLNRKVFLSGQRMKALQPEMERIKAKYGSDKSKAAEMNQEVMGLYKKHGVNPLGSCLPMLAQLPVFLGLWSALSHSIELYQTNFLWIPDLSARDPYFIFPALWTLSLLAYVKLNPQQPTQPGAPDMKWIMIAMNLVFGFISKDWAGGLTLYLFVSNLVGITQQWMYQRASKLQPIREGA
jgi:YidC/Oxa1 family membrane protein insertase